LEAGGEKELIGKAALVSRKRPTPIKITGKKAKNLLPFNTLKGGEVFFIGALRYWYLIFQT